MTNMIVFWEKNCSCHNVSYIRLR